jgi:hypothetical protein
MDFQTHEGPNGEGDVAHLPTSRPDLRFLDTTALLDTSMAALDRPGFPGQLLMLLRLHFIVSACTDGYHPAVGPRAHNSGRLRVLILEGRWAVQNFAGGIVYEIGNT